jgi:hypothetical protein
MTDRRLEPLPGQAPKPADDDPDAPARLAAIMASPSYLPADADPAFLQLADMRGERLQLDYAKAGTLLVAAGIDHTIGGFSAHADQAELLRWHERAGGAERTLLVHGEASAMATFAALLPGVPVLMPASGSQVSL